jgi:glyoxylase-like metal-dependent hydrolase (beta-lactamase superfamily II)
MSRGWFSIKSVAEQLYQITEPIQELEPRYGLTGVHCYLLVGDDQAVLIDTGCGVADLKGIARELTDLPLKILNTHFHWDHTGGNIQFSHKSIHVLEADLVQEQQDLCLDPAFISPRVEQLFLRLGTRPDEVKYLPAPPTKTFEDGQELDLGSIRLTVLHTPGHSPGHVAFWWEEKGILFTGDTAYQGPVFSCFPGGSPADLLQSARRLAGLRDVQLICPGHNNLIKNGSWLMKFLDSVKQAVDGAGTTANTGRFIPGMRIDFDELSIWLPLDWNYS